jgi:hypothetical protein
MPGTSDAPGGAAAGSLRPFEIANADTWRASRLAPQRGQSGDALVFTTREKKL